MTSSRDIELIKNNARTGGLIAVELAGLRRERGGGGGGGRSFEGRQRTRGGVKVAGEERDGMPGREGEEGGRSSSRKRGNKGQIVVLGASILDFTAKMKSQHVLVSTTGIITSGEGDSQINWVVNVVM